MIKECKRGGERTNVSEMHSELVDLTDAIATHVDNMLERGLRYISDRVEFRYHESDTFMLTTTPMVHRIPFYPLDKNLSPTDIEDINLHAMGYVSFESTEIYTYVSIMVREIISAIEAVMDTGATKVIVHFAPADTIEYHGSVAKVLYGFIVRKTLQMETSFFIEIVEEINLEDL